MSRRDRVTLTFMDEEGHYWFGTAVVERWIPHDGTTSWECPLTPKEFVRFELAVDEPRPMSLTWENK